MEIGKKIYELRKKNNYSQEQLAEEMNVVRQTISKWELSETAPDLKQAKTLAKIFKVSLDELTNNDISKYDIKTKTINKQTKHFKIIFIIIYLITLISLITITIYFTTKKDFTKEYQTEFYCTINNEQLFITSSLEEDNIYYVYVYIDGYLDKKHPAGKTMPEVLQTIKEIKKLLIYEGGTCK